MKLGRKNVRTIIGVLLVFLIVISLGFVINRTLAQKALVSKKENGSMGRIAIVGYKPKAGKADALMALMKTHVPRLRAEGLATSRESVIMTAKDGTIIEVFEWKSAESIQAAHTNPVVGAMWKEYSDICDYVPVGSIDETKQMFADFTAIDGGAIKQ